MQKLRRCSRPDRLGVVLLALAAPLAAQAAVPRLAVVYETTAAPELTVQVQELCRALMATEAAGRIARETRLGDRAVAITVTVDGAGRATTTPALPVLHRRLQQSDVVVCVGLRPLQALLQGAPLPAGLRLYSLGVPGLACCRPDGGLLPNLERVRGGVAADVALADVVRGLPRLLAEPGPIGVVASSQVPAAILEPAAAAAQQAGLRLQVQRIDRAADYAAAVQQLVTAGCRSIAVLADPGGAFTPVAALQHDGLRLWLHGRKVALMGGPGELRDGHFTFAVDPTAAATRLCRMIVDDRLDARPPGIVPAPAATGSVDQGRCRLDQVALVPAPASGR